MTLMEKSVAKKNDSNKSDAPGGAIPPVAASLVDAAPAGEFIDPDKAAAEITGDGTTPEESKPPVLIRDGKSLEWTDPSNGKSEFEIEVSRDRHSWNVEATQIAGTNAYAPRDCAGTAFYRVRSVSGPLRAIATSNVVVIHFN